ncbi:MAG TPA: flagellar motor protein MotB [Cyanobacteria bacterium UBA8543]|nr:flagellar motor protein MotB [Cyanobacteria bacterium UBA8543]
MTSSSDNDVSNETLNNNHSSTQDELEELRRLLFEPEITQVRKVQEKIDNLKLNTDNLSQVLPNAIAQRPIPDKELTEVLVPTVEDAIYTSVRKDAEIIATAIFPVLLPGIRKAVAAAISEMTQSLNQTLDHSFSTKSLKWRLEALRTGKSFAEIVLLHSLLYRVEQVFLIHRESGLVLQHIVAPEVTAQDADMVSGMLTAIRNFVQDSFNVHKGDSLDALRFGELALWIEQGSQAILAGVIRGNAPKELRLVFQDTLNKIHLQKGSAISAFDGDATPFAETQQDLEACLQAQYESKPQKPSPVLWIVVGAIAVALGTWIGFSIRDHLRWANYLEKLNAQPGIVVTKAEKQWGKYFVSGLRDPLAADPIKIMKAAHINPKTVKSQWKPYVSLEPALFANRAKQLLQPPKTVSLQVDENGVLSATGVAPHQWIVETRKRVQFIPGINQFQEKNLLDQDLRKLQLSKEQIEKQTLQFTGIELQLAPNQSNRIQNLVQAIKKLLDSAKSLNKDVRVTIIGRANVKGEAKTNLTLSQARANVVLDTLVSNGVNRTNLEAVGVGSTESLNSKFGVQKSEINRGIAVSPVISFRIAIANKPNSRTR